MTFLRRGIPTEELSPSRGSSLPAPQSGPIPGCRFGSLYVYIHVDRPFLSLNGYQGASVEALRSATRQTFDNLVEFPGGKPATALRRPRLIHVA